jgi:putative endonuclease
MTQVRKKKTSPLWTVYILACADGTLYTGITTDLPRRLAQHEQGKGAKYTRGRGPYTMLYTETCKARGQALKREAAIKALDRAEKLAFFRSCDSN